MSRDDTQRAGEVLDAQHDRVHESESATAAIVRAVTAMAECDSEALPQVLHDVVDTDALDTLFTATDDGMVDGYVTFVYCGYEVTIHTDRTIVVRE